MVATGAADESYVRSTTPRSSSGLGSQELLSTNRQARMTIQFYHNDTPSASLAVWIYIVPNETMRCPLLLGRDSWMCFHSRSYQTLTPTLDGRLFGKLTLSHTFGDARNSAAAYVHSHGATDTAYHLVYDGPGVSLNIAPQLVPVHLIRLDGSPALTGHYMVNMITTHGYQDPLEHFVGSGRQTIPLAGYRYLEPGDILGTALAPILRVPLEALAQHDARINVTPVAESLLPSTPLTETTNTTPDPPDGPPPELLGRQYPVTTGLSHGRPQWIRRVRRSSASSENLVSLVITSALGPPRLHDPTGSSRLAPPAAGSQLPNGQPNAHHAPRRTIPRPGERQPRRS